MDLTRPSVPLDRGGNKEYINGLIVVAALVATVTFAAGSTIPGGFNSSAPHLGSATLATDHSLIVYLICDTMAMGSSVVAVVSLIWAQLGDPALFRSSVNVALPLLCFSLMSMANAYFSAMMITVGTVLGFNLIILLVYLIFVYVMFVRLVPHMFLQLCMVQASVVFGAVFLSFLKLVDEEKDESYQTSTYSHSHRSMKKVESAKISGNDHLEKLDTT